ncbi:MAG: transferrin-binding protein-like solute binding protein [Boseongicola sp.]
MLNKIILAGIILITFSACGGVAIVPSRAGNLEFFIGAETPEAAANGLEFADGTQSIADAEAREIQIKLARFVRDPTTGETRIVLSDETVTLPVTFTDYGDRDIAVTLDGETLTFVDGEATLSSGQSLWSYMNYKMVHSGTGAIYTYGQYNEGIDDPLDMEGFFAFGFETNPNQIATLSGSATYTGSYFGYVQTFDLDGSLTASGLRTIGAINMETDFSEAHVSGRLTGWIDPDGDDTEYELIFLGAPIVGNGFVGSADITCPAGASCTSETYVGGAFFGENGAEISGVIGIDETVAGPGDDQGYQFVGAAGFSSAIDE